jgi:hypothetical protein
MPIATAEAIAANTPAMTIAAPIPSIGLDLLEDSCPPRLDLSWTAATARWMDAENELDQMLTHDELRRGRTLLIRDVDAG